MLDNLKKLAAQSSTEKRRMLLEETTHLFIESANQHSDRELILFKDVFLKLLGDVDADAKIQFSTSIAPVDQTPRELALELAQQPIEIAKPILECSSSLNEDDLLNIAKTKSTDYRLAITKRPDVTVAVSDEIISHREEIVIESICENLEAQISESGFETIVELAEPNPSIKKYLSDRSDIPNKLISQVMTMLEPHDRLKFQSLVKTRGDDFAATFLDSVETQSSAYIAEIDKERENAGKMLSKIRDGEVTPAKLIKIMCNEENPFGVAIVLSELAKISENIVTSVLLNRNGRAICILCKSLNVSVETFQAILSLRQKHLGINSSSNDPLLSFFNDMEISDAKRSIRYLKVKLQST